MQINLLLDGVKQWKHPTFTKEKLIFVKHWILVFWPTSRLTKQICQVSVLSVWTICSGVSWVQLHHGRFSLLSAIGLN